MQNGEPIHKKTIEVGPATIIYHANCMDGTCAAAIALNVLKDRKPLLIPMSYGDDIRKVFADLPSPVEQSDVFIVDFSLPSDQLDWLAEVSIGVKVIDHHRSAIERLAGYKNDGVHLLLNEKWSGAGMTFEHFFGDGESKPPLVVQYVQDRDLWKFELPMSKAVNAYLATIPNDPLVWQTMDLLKVTDYQSWAHKGQAILAYMQKIIDGAVKRFILCDIGGEVYPCLNTTTLVGEIGEAFLEANPKIATCCMFFIDLEKRKTVFSFRSKTGTAKAAAELLGGGGHPNAAGASSSQIVPEPIMTLGGRVV